MNKFVTQLRMLLVLAAIALAIPAWAEVDQDELQKVRATVSSMFGEIEAEHVQPSPIDGWYTVRKGAIVAYISGDGRYLLQGDIIDLERSVNLSETARNEARLDLLAGIPEDETITFSPVDVKYSISIFTDIDCGYCRRLHSQMDEYLEQGIEIRYLLYPRNGPTSESWAKAEQVWCADDRNEALTLAKIDEDFETHNCNASVVSNHYAMGRDIGLTGTPAIVFPDGALVPGYLPPAALAEKLAENSE